MATPMIPENWPKLLEPGLRSIFQSRLENRESLGKRGAIFNVLDSERKFEEILGVGALASDGWELDEQGRVKYDSVKPGFVTRFEHIEYAKGMTVRRTLLDDNLYAASQLPRSVTGQPIQLADSAFVQREKAAAEVLNNAFTDSGKTESGFDIAGPDGVGLVSAAHPLAPGVTDTQSNEFALALSTDNVDTVRQAMRAVTDDKGNIVVVQPNTLIVPPELETEALKIALGDREPGTANNDLNIVGRRIANVISWDYLTDADAWFLEDPNLAEQHLLWFERVPLEFRATEDFDTLQAKYRAYMRYSRGWSDWRFIAGSNPA